MEIGNILEGTNGVVGKYSINKINYNSTSGIIHIDVTCQPIVSIQYINVRFSISNEDFFEKEKRENIYKKRKNITKKLLE